MSSDNDPPVGRRHEIGGRPIFLHRSGEGRRAVVVLPGAGLVGLDYLPLQERLAETAECVVYDRGGTGWSGPAELPRTATEVTDEFHALLRAARVPTPCVLIGHSLGGAYARHHAARHPGDVAGLVLLDPFHEDMVTRAPKEVLEHLARMKAAELPTPTQEQLDRSRPALAEHFARWPQVVRDPLIDLHLRDWATGWQEDMNLYDVVADELRSAPDLSDIPVAVLSAVGYDAMQAQLWPEDLLRRINEEKQSIHAELAASVPRGSHRALDVGHGWMHLQAADAVVQAATEALDRVGG